MDTRSKLQFYLAVILLLPASTSFAALDKVRIGMGAFSPTNSAVWIAEERGFFKKHGVEPK